MPPVPMMSRWPLRLANRSTFRKDGRWKLFKTESEFNRWATAVVRKCNTEVLNVVAGAPGQDPGWPDRYFAHPVWSGWVEGKKDDGGLRESQRRVFPRLTRCGVQLVVLRYLSTSDALQVESWTGEVLSRAISVRELRAMDGGLAGRYIIDLLKESTT